jgi:hypothetical protein
MRISKVSIRNILGIEELELTPKGYTQISGPNGTGKTSVLEAIKAALGVGDDATLLRKGAERGEVVLVLDNGTEIRKAVSPAGARTTVKGADGKALPKPQAVIQALADMLSVNPVDFLLAKPKERVRVLLDAMPLEADIEKLQQLSGVQVQVPEGTHALEAIETVRKQVYDDRTGTNRAVKEKEATINQLRQAMPDAPGGVEGDEATLQEEIDAATAARDDKLGKIRTKLDSIKSAAQQKIDAIRTKLQADIDALKVAAQAEVDAINSDTAENERKASAAHQAAVTAHLEATQARKHALDTIRANRDAAAKRAGTLETISRLEEELEHLEQDAERQTKALADIDAYKSELLSSLPIKGLEVRDGEVFCDGVPLDRVNTARQVQIAVDLAKLRAGDLGIACVDRIESLDKDSRDALRKGAIEAGLQLFVTKVTEAGEFAVHTTDR